MRSATPVEASVTIARELAEALGAVSAPSRRRLGAGTGRSGFARDPRLQRRQSFREPRLLGAPQLWRELAFDLLGVGNHGRHVVDRALGDDRQLARRRRRARGELL